MEHPFSRTELLTGREGIRRLADARVAVFGIGGVGGYVVEALARSGTGTLDLIDHDKISLTNLNRQIIATRKTIGKYKVDVARERIMDINPEAVVNCYKTFYLPETAGQFDFARYDYVVDAIDTVTGKIGLAMQAAAAGTPLISAMGAGNKMDPAAFMVADIYETSVCPLAKVMRRELKKRGIKKLKVVYSQEIPVKPCHLMESSTVTDHGVKDREETERPGDTEWAGGDGTDTGEIKSQPERRSVPGSMAFVPSVAGLIIAGEVVKDLLKR